MADQHDARWQGSLQAAVQDARRDPGVAVLEGVHALKHAVRFGAEILRVASPDPAETRRLLARLAPDVMVGAAIEAVPASTWEALTSGGLPSPAIAIARRPPDVLDEVLASRDVRAVVVLEAPSHLGNVGAVIRVAAATDQAGVVVVGDADPWHPRAIRGAAGLQYAVPVGRRDVLPAGPRPLVAVTPDGDALGTVDLPAGALLAFGTERAGLSDDLVARTDARVRLPMRPGVSSLNLATSVAALLYGAGMVGPESG